MMFLFPGVMVVVIYNRYNEIIYRINTILCLIKVNSNTIELTVHTSSNRISDLLCVVIQVCFCNNV